MGCLVCSTTGEWWPRWYKKSIPKNVELWKAVTLTSTGNLDVLIICGQHNSCLFMCYRGVQPFQFSDQHHQILWPTIATFIWKLSPAYKCFVMDISPHTIICYHLYRGRQHNIIMTDITESNELTCNIKVHMDAVRNYTKKSITTIHIFLPAFQSKSGRHLLKIVDGLLKETHQQYWGTGWVQIYSMAWFYHGSLSFNSSLLFTTYCGCGMMQVTEKNQWSIQCRRQANGMTTIGFHKVLAHVELSMQPYNRVSR